MSAKHRESFTIIHGGLAQSNTSMVPTTNSVPDEPSNASMMGDGGRPEKDGWFDRVCHRLAEIDALKPGWDSYGADRFPKTTVNFTAMVLAAVWSEASPLPFPNISPMSNGAIMVEWRSPTHELTLEVNGPNDVDVLFEELSTGKTDAFHVTSNFLHISDALELGAQRVRAVA
jgi:hypothetical protein